eukprot:TRINITY_DN2337_c0_g1_i1.p1 TRINITY_DN2337_c0_g1~~TRINITY_DN2337_c0_g1_i1.p1  ORF type:complete len:685 (-),score=116.43 TRINITY_DN2337_c0_g1_i1:350-2404(-)
MAYYAFTKAAKGRSVGFEHDEWNDEKLAMPAETFSRTELSSMSSDDGEKMGDPSLHEDKEIMQVIGEKFLAIYDKSIQRRNMINFILAVTSMFLMMGEIWVAYDHEGCWKDFLSERTACDVRVAANQTTLAECEDVFKLGIDTRKKNCLKANITTFVLKCLLSINTAGLLYGIIDYYRFQLMTEKGASWFITDSVKWRELVWVCLAAEVLICIVHPFPAALDRSFVPYNDKLGLLMFFRGYLVIRPLRDFTPIYKQRGMLLHDRQVKKSGAVEFNWALSVKFLFLQYTWAFVISGVVISWSLAAYVVWVFEREVALAFEEPYISLWVMMAAMSTVGYGDISPYDAFSQVITGFAAVVGIILSALLVFAVMDSLTLTPQDVRVKNLWIRKKRQDDQRHAAAAYIQLFWRHHCDKERIKLEPAAASHMLGWFHSPEYQHVYLKFNRQNAIFKGILRACRRDLSTAFEIDDLVIDRVEAKMMRMSTNIANRLAFRLGLRPHQKAATELSTMPELADRINRLKNGSSDIIDTCDKILSTVVSDHHDSRSHRNRVRRKASSSWFSWFGGDSTEEDERTPSPSPSPRRHVEPPAPRHRDLDRVDRDSNHERRLSGSSNGSGGSGGSGSRYDRGQAGSPVNRSDDDDSQGSPSRRSSPSPMESEPEPEPEPEPKKKRRVRRKKKKKTDDDE